MKQFKRHLVTSALPYANGPIHIGHLAGVYIPSDIYTRYLRLRGKDVIHICGSDEHGEPITIKARQEGLTPQQIVDRYHRMNKESFEKFGITFDIYSRTSAKIHYETSSEFFINLYEKGEFTEKSIQQFYDEEAGQFLSDRYITGTCPHCNSDSAYGDQCENCGTSLNQTDLVNPISAITGSKPVMKKTKHWFLPLDRHEGFLKKWILEDNKHWKGNVYGQCKSWLDQGLHPRAVSRDLSWGVPVPLENAKGKVMYVWFDAPIGYISATKELTPDWEKYWKSTDSRLVHFIGKDNIVFHCIIFPVMLKSEGSFILPENVPANEFLNLEGNKISTSRNWAVWLHEYLEEFPDKQDVLRYVLCASMPETKDNDFTWKDFQSRNNNELVAILGNFVNRTIVLTNKYFSGKVPPRENPGKYDREVADQIPEIKKRTGEYLEQFRFRDALREAMNLARLGNKYLADTEPWKIFKSDPGRVGTILNISLQITAGLSSITDPFMPFTAARLKKFLNIENIGWEDTGNIDFLKPGHQVNPPELLFEKIEDDQITKQLNKLMENRQASEKAATNIEQPKGIISYEDFAKMDIRTGTVLKAEKIAKTRKLMKLSVNTGVDTRTVVAGIAEHFDPVDIEGKKVAILINLDPRKIRGVESQGMILMSEDPDGKLVFVSPSDDATDGSIIK